MKFPLRSLSLSLSGFLAFFPTLGFALNQPVMFEPNQAFPLTPRVTGLGMAGDDELVWGDMMLPLAGNHNQVWYVDVQAKTAFDSDWLGSLGTGARKVFNDNSIWGAYVFVDRNVSPDSNLFWFVSPGIEELGNLVDFRANGYFPTSSKKQYGSTDWADNFGVYNYVSFQGHTQYDILMTQDEEVGWGYDAEIGTKIPGLHGTRAYIGGYHFGFDSASDINGVEGRVELPINRYLGVTMRDSYDNEQHNTFLIGLKVTLRGVNAHPSNPHQAIQERILDPIERNLATLGQGVGEPVQEVLTPVPAANPVNPNPPFPPLTVERDNIWFFSGTGTDSFSGSIENCTMENVCIDSSFNQDTVNGINALKLSSSEINDKVSTSPSFYLAPGVYTSLNRSGTGPLRLTNDWIWGKSADFLTEELRTLTGAMIFSGSNNKLNTILLQSNGSQNVGIALNPNSALLIENSQIGSPTNMAGATYTTAIQADNASLTIADYRGVGNSVIRAYSDDGSQVRGIAGINSRVTIRNSSVFATSNFTLIDETPFVQRAIALELFDAPLVTITGSTIMGEAIWNGNLPAGFSTTATAIATTDSTITIANSRVEADATVTGNNAGNNLASAIGGNNVDGITLFQANKITIGGNLTAINANAVVGGGVGSSGVNAAVGIGENVVDLTAVSSLFSENVFTINTESHINSVARVTGSVSRTNMATAIGVNAVNASDSIFMDNTFTLNQVELTSLAQANSTVVMGGFNMAAGIGSNAAFGVADGSFEENQITLENGSSISSTARVTTNNGINLAVGLGGNAVSGGTANFSDNETIKLIGSNINARAETSGGAGNGVNMAAGIGGNAFNNGTANFIGNTNIAITGSRVEGTAEIISTPVDVGGLNFAVGLGGNAAVQGAANFRSNVISISDSEELSGSALITGGGVNVNLATGLGGNILGTFGVDTANFINSPVTVANSTIEAIADEDLNFSTNRARGFNLANASTGTVSITGANSLVAAFATSPGTNQATGLFAVSGVTVTMAGGTLRAKENGVSSACTSGGGNFTGVNPTVEDCVP